ncbi:hypothetical protein BJ878DRAFT_539071 [Calycina marina]|uniref:Late embryogenesis abundant protein LEA-2 subgroup domain-containing protein n=1 Tax=Calycina marina TaxID=1763456 RepID=A0A9P8CHT4_9HELO|nr:hypothetical protein BJ878DRAFT_539071 [Calycina marina]
MKSLLQAAALALPFVSASFSDLDLSTPAADHSFAFIAVEIPDGSSRRGAFNEVLGFRLDVFPTAEACGHANITIDGQQLSLEKKGEVLVGNGLLSMKDNVEINASWKISCITVNGKPDSQFLKFEIDSIYGRSFVDVGFSSLFKQTGNTEIIQSNTDLSMPDLVAANPNPEALVPTEAASHPPKKCIKKEFKELDWLLAQRYELELLIDEKKQSIADHASEHFHEEIKDCDNLKCVVATAAKKAQHAAHNVYEKIFGEEDFDHKSFGHEHHEPDSHRGPPGRKGKGNEHKEKHGKHPEGPPHRPHSNGTHGHHNGTAPPHHRKPHHFLPICRMPPNHGGHHGPPPHGPPGGDKHHGPPPPGPPPPGPPPPGPPPGPDGPHGPDGHGGPPPPGPDGPHGSDGHDGPPPPGLDGPHGPDGHDGPPPPGPDRPHGPDGHDGPPPPGPDRPHGPDGHDGPPPPGPDRPHGPDGHDGPPPPGLDGPHGPDRHDGPPPPGPEGPLDHFGGPPPHGFGQEHPPFKPLGRPLFILKFIAIGFLAAFLLAVVYHRVCTPKRKADRSARSYQRSAPRNAFSRLFARMAGNYDFSDDYEEKRVSLLSDMEGGVSNTVTGEIVQLQNAASVVDDMVQESRSSETSTIPEAHLLSIQTQSVDPVHSYGLSSPEAYDQLPAYMPAEEEDGDGMIADGFGYTPGSNGYTPSNSDSGSVSDILGPDTKS